MSADQIDVFTCIQGLLQLCRIIGPHSSVNLPGHAPESAKAQEEAHDYRDSMVLITRTLLCVTTSISTTPQFPV